MSKLGNAGLLAGLIGLGVIGVVALFVICFGIGTCFFTALTWLVWNVALTKLIGVTALTTKQLWASGFIAEALYCVFGGGGRSSS